MNTLLPIFVKLEGKPCLVVGGGKVAVQKIQQLLKSKATVTVISSESEKVIREWAEKGVITLVSRPYQPGDANNYFLVIGATDEEPINAQVFHEASARNIPVNIVDKPQRCTFTMASIYEEGDLKIAISTNGKSPALGQLIRDKISQELGPEYARLLEKLGYYREEILKKEASPEKRQKILKNRATREFQRLIAMEKRKVIWPKNGETVRVGRKAVSQGKVYLVGAGPGDPELITVKGLKAIRSADIILYDTLIHPQLLEYARKEAKRVYVGKKPGKSHCHTDQEFINRLLITKVEEGNIVVRLKGGDPFIFARGGEEAEALAKADVPFEIIPGVTAGTSAPAYAGIPLTHRDYSSTVAFVTGHLCSSEKSPINWEYLSKSVDTIVIFMGVKNLLHITRGLISAGKPGKTPTAAIYNASLEDQKIMIGSLENIAAKIQKAKISSPAIIIIGEVVKLHNDLKWHHEKPSRYTELIFSPFQLEV